MSATPGVAGGPAHARAPLLGAAELPRRVAPWPAWARLVWACAAEFARGCVIVGLGQLLLLLAPAYELYRRGKRHLQGAGASGHAHHYGDLGERGTSADGPPPGGPRPGSHPDGGTPPCHPFRSVLITGASSGIGAALAAALAAPGVTLHLCARRREELQAVADTVEALGGAAHVVVVDVTDRAAMAEAVAGAAVAGGAPLDLVVANAGCSTYQAGEGRADHLGVANDGVYSCMDTNLSGALHTLLPAARLMTERGGGQLVAVASNSGALLGWPGDPAYAAAKAGLIAWCRGMRPRLRAHNVGITVVCPGIVETPLTATRRAYKLPGMSAAGAAAQIVAAALDDPGMATFPVHYHVLLQPLLQLLPRDMLGRF